MPSEPTTGAWRSTRRDPGPGAVAGTGLAVLSYNVWGVFVAPRIKERMLAISERLGAYDVVCLQEQFDAADARLLFGSDANRAAFPHVHRFESSAVGSGLTIASRFPIVSNFFVPFRAGGMLHRLWEGDAFANKGISVSRIKVPTSKLGGSSDDESAELLVLNTHLIAPYQQTPQWEKEGNSGFRIAQMHQLAELITTIVGDGKTTPFILCGDFNCGIDTPELELLHAELSARRGLVLSEAMRAVPTHGLRDDLDHIFVSHPSVVITKRTLAMTDGQPSLPQQQQQQQHAQQPILSDHIGVVCHVKLAALSDAATKDLGTVMKPQGAERAKVLVYASKYLRENAATHRRLRIHGTLLAAGLAAVAIGVGCVEGPGWLKLVTAFVFGAVGATALIVAQFSRRYDEITFRTAAEDIGELL